MAYKVLILTLHNIIIFITIIIKRVVVSVREPKPPSPSRPLQLHWVYAKVLRNQPRDHPTKKVGQTSMLTRNRVPLRVQVSGNGRSTGRIVGGSDLENRK